jgi:hypothetical protein
LRSVDMGNGARILARDGRCASFSAISGRSNDRQAGFDSPSWVAALILRPLFVLAQAVLRSGHQASAIH